MSPLYQVKLTATQLYFLAIVSSSVCRCGCFSAMLIIWYSGSGSGVVAGVGSGVGSGVFTGVGFGVGSGVGDGVLLMTSGSAVKDGVGSGSLFLPKPVTKYKTAGTSADMTTNIITASIISFFLLTFILLSIRVRFKAGFLSILICLEVGV